MTMERAARAGAARGRGSRLRLPERLRRGTAAPLLATASFVACEAPPDLPADARVRYDTVGGVVHVVSGSRGEWARGGAWAVPDSGVVIGRMDGAEEEVFGAVTGVVVDADGRIWVADGQASEIRVFGPEGTFLRRVGRAGEGPGEFRNISGLALAPDGVGALDGQLGRVTVFRPDGGVARTFRLERAYMVLEQGAPMAFDDEGRFFDRARLSLRPFVDSVGVITYSPAGEPADTALLGVVLQDDIPVERDGRLVMSFRRPFAPNPSLAIGRDGRIHFARGDAYRIDVVGPAGDTLLVIRRGIAPRPVGDEERQAALERVRGRFEEAGTVAPPGIELPDTKPVIARLVVDDAGNLWALNPPDDSWRAMEWWVHAPDGRYLGAVATPVMDVMHIGEDFVAGVVTDELGVQRVKVVPVRK